MQQLNPIDAALLLMETVKTPCHVSMISVYDPSTCPDKAPSFEEIFEAVRVSLPAANRFRSKIVRVPFDLDYAYWVEDEDFDLRFHMRHLALPKPGSWVQFREQVSRLVSRPLDMTRPPWEMTVIEGLDNIKGLPPGCFATVLKIHHCAIDGESGVGLATVLHQDSPDKPVAVLEDNWQPEITPGNRELLRRAGVHSIRKPLTIAKLLMSNSSKLLRSALDDLRSDKKEEDARDRKVPATIFNAPVSAHRIFDEARCTLDELKLIRKEVPGATINDVCLTIVSEGMRRYLDAKGELPAESLVTAVPISTRTPENAGASGNQVSVIFTSMHTDIVNPIERLAAISAETREKKAVQSGVVMKVLLEVVHNLPGALVGAVGRVMPVISVNAKAVINTMVTNVPGPMTPLYLLGAKLVQSSGCPPLLHGGALLHSVSSYNGGFMVSFTACRDLLPDPDFYRQCLEEAMRDMIAAAGGGAKPKRAPRKPRAKKAVS